MSEMKKIRMGEASFNYSPETAYEKNGNVYCNTCHEQINGEVVNMMGTWMCFRIQCQCEKKEEKRWKERERVMRVNQLKDTCFTNPKQRNYTLDKCLISNEKTIGVVSNYIKKFDEVRKKNVGLLFFGEVGSGKSYLAAAIANAVMEEYEITCKMRNFSQIINDLQSGGFDLDKNRYIDSLVRTPLLILDDLGIERNTPYALEQVYNIINGRSLQGLPTIITTNLSLEDIKNHTESIELKRIYSRVLEMCIPVLVSGADIREQIHKKKIQESRELLL